MYLTISCNLRFCVNSKTKTKTKTQREQVPLYTLHRCHSLHTRLLTPSSWMAVTSCRYIHNGSHELPLHSQHFGPLTPSPWIAMTSCHHAETISDPLTPFFMNGSDQLPFTFPPLTSSAPALDRRYTSV